MASRAPHTPFFPLNVVVGKSPMGVVFGTFWNGWIVRVNVPTLNHAALDFTGGSADLTLRSTTDSGHPTTKNVRTTVATIKRPSRSPNWEPKRISVALRLTGRPEYEKRILGEGVYVGHHEGSGAAIFLTPDGVKRGTIIAIILEHERWVACSV